MPFGSRAVLVTLLLLLLLLLPAVLLVAAGVAGCCILSWVCNISMPLPLLLPLLPPAPSTALLPIDALLLLLLADPTAPLLPLPLPAAFFSPVASPRNPTSTVMARQGTSSGHSSSSRAPGSDCSAPVAFS
jgi:hypothetical protein